MKAKIGRFFEVAAITACWWAIGAFGIRKLSELIPALRAMTDFGIFTKVATSAGLFPALILIVLSSIFDRVHLRLFACTILVSLLDRQA